MWKTLCRYVLPSSSGQKMVEVSTRQLQSCMHSKDMHPSTRLCGDVPSRDNDMNTNPLSVQLPVKIQQCSKFIYSLFFVLLTVHLIIFILVIHQLDAQNLFYSKFISCLYTFRAPRAHRQRSKLYYTASGTITLKQVSGLKLLE